MTGDSTLGRISALSNVAIDAPPEHVLSAVADHTTVRPKILTSQHSGYRVLAGGQGAGTVATWKLQATKLRLVDVTVTATVAGLTVSEKRSEFGDDHKLDVAPSGRGSTVTVKTSWQGSDGIQGIFEKFFAPMGLRKIQDELVANLKKQVEGR